MEIPLLKRREIEAQIVGPVFEAIAKEVGRERAVETVGEAIQAIARKQGEGLAQEWGDRGVKSFGRILEMWSANGALEIEMIERSELRLIFNVTRCRFAELYRDLVMEDLGVILSCNRDKGLVEGFNPQITLTRTQTILEGAAFCDFRFELKSGLDGE